MADEIVIVGSDGKEYPFPKGTDEKAIAGYFDAKKVKPVKLLQGSETKQQRAPLFGSPMSPLKPPGAGLLEPGLRSVATVGTQGMISPGATSEEAMVQGAAAIPTMGMAGLGANLADRLGTKLLASGFGPKMAGFMTKPLLRMSAAGAGGYAGSLTYSGITAAAGLEGAPQSIEEASARAAEAGAANILIQGGFEAAVPLAKATVGKLWTAIQNLATGSKTAQNMRKLEGLKEELTSELKRVNIREIKDAQAEEIQKATTEIVSDMGQMRSPEQMKDLGKTIETRVNAKLAERMGPLHEELDRAASAAKTTVDARPIAKVIDQIAADEPRGQGVARPFTKPTGRFREIVRDARSGQPIEGDVTVLKETGKPGRPAGKDQYGTQTTPPVPPTPPITSVIRMVVDPGVNESVKLDAMLKARGTISREIANPATDDETRGMLQKILKPWDQAIKSGLAEINPSLAVKWDVAQDLWHKGKLIQDKVVMERLKNAGVRSLTAEIQPNAPRNVEQMRLLFNEAFPKEVAASKWKDLQRAKVEELMGTDLASFGKTYREYGGTMNRLFQTPEEKATALRLVTLSDEFAHLTTNPSVKNDQKLEALKASISLLESGGAGKDAGKRMVEFMTKPHLLMYGSAALMGGHAYGAAGVGGALVGMAGIEAIGAKAVPAIIRAAEHPAQAGRLITSLNAWIKDGNPNTAANLARSLIAAYEVGDAVQRADAIKEQEARKSAQGQK